ncbi:unnamed protein product, partial [Strongylus vulgaris]
MNLIRFVLLTILGGCLGTNSKRKSEEFDLPIVINATGLSPCAHNCLDSLVVTSKNENVRQISKAGGDHKILLKEFAPICTSTGCMTACIADLLNKKCGTPSGSIIVESLLRPLSITSALLEELGLRAKLKVQKQLPQPCQYIMEKRQLEGIVKGIPPKVDGIVQEKQQVERKSEIEAPEEKLEEHKPDGIEEKQQVERKSEIEAPEKKLEEHKPVLPKPRLSPKGFTGEAKGVVLIAAGTAKVTKQDKERKEEELAKHPEERLRQIHPREAVPTSLSKNKPDARQSKPQSQPKDSSKSTRRFSENEEKSRNTQTVIIQLSPQPKQGPT